MEGSRAGPFRPEPDISGTGYGQPHPITIGRETLVRAEDRTDVPLLSVPSFPLLGRLWALAIEQRSDLEVSPAFPAAGAAPFSAPWLSLLLRWTQGNANFTAELDYPGGGSCFQIVADSLNVYARNRTPSPTPATARDVTIAASCGYNLGTRPTAIPRRTVRYTVPAASTLTLPVPLSAGSVQIQSAAAFTVAFADFTGATTSAVTNIAPQALELAQGTSFASVTNPAAAAIDVWLIYRISL